MNEPTVIQPRGPTEIGPGLRLNETYEIVELVGEGGLSQVYRAFNIRNRHPVAIKFMRADLLGDADTMELFQREASILAELSHDAIVRYLGFSFDPLIRREYLVMEFVEGLSLETRLRQKRLTAAEGMILKTRLAGGLSAAHRRGAVHRDMSPDNVILPGGDIENAKIIDFGIAKALKFAGHTVIGTGLAGKFSYMSPEQVFGGDVAEKSDVYSLGLVLAAALRGEPLDMGKTLAELAPKRSSVPELADVDAALRPLVSRMLRPNPAERPSMDEVAAWQPEPARSASDAAKKPVPQPTQKSSSLIGAVAAALGAFVIGASLVATGWVFRDDLSRLVSGGGRQTASQGRTEADATPASPPEVTAKTETPPPEPEVRPTTSAPPSPAAATQDQAPPSAAAPTPASSRPEPTLPAPIVETTPSPPAVSPVVAETPSASPTPEPKPSAMASSAFPATPPASPEPKPSAVAPPTPAQPSVAVAPTATPTPTFSSPAPRPTPTTKPSSFASLTPTSPSPVPVTMPANEPPRAPAVLTTLDTAYVGRPFRQAFAPFESADPDGLRISTQGHPPAGLVVTDAGRGAAVVEGVPTRSGSTAFAIVATDRNKRTTTMHTIAIVVDPPAAFATPVAPATRPPPPPVVAATTPPAPLTQVAAATGGEALATLLKRYDTGECWLARSLAATGESPHVEAVSEDSAQLTRFADDVSRRLGPAVAIDRVAIDRAQCPALALARDALAPPRLELAARNVGGAVPLAGAVRGLAGKALTILVVRDDGKTLSIKETPEAGDGARFSLDITKVDDEDVGRKLVVAAILSPRPLPSLREAGADQPRAIMSLGAAADLFPKLAAEAAEAGASADIEVVTLVRP